MKIFNYPLLLVFFALVSWQEPKQKPKNQPGAADRRPNILFVISDDQSFPHASAYGYKAVKTPAFDRIAKEGILFTNAFVASPGCSPSRAALLTGRNCWEIEEAGTHDSFFPRKYAAFPDLLAQAGYATGLTGKGWGPGEYKEAGWQHNPAGPSYDSRKKASPPQVSKLDYAGNFADFYARKPKDKPFFFWMGAHEPHRGFEKGIGLKNGKRLEEVVVPSFLPDSKEVRSDMLDYLYEIEWYDQQLGLILKQLEEAGELNNTFIVVTSDNGMAFPRAKANTYEYGIHVPLAMRWGNQIKGGRKIEQVVSTIDLAPTLLQAAGVTPGHIASGKHPMSGISMLNFITGKKGSQADTLRTGVYASRERHSSSRWNNLSYPQRALRTNRFLYIRNFKPDRWPAGDPQKLEKDPKTGQMLPGPMHGGYHDIDASPTLTYLVANREDNYVSRYFHLAVDKRPGEELYDIKKDPGCLNNLINNPGYAQIKAQFAGRMENYLRQTQDPRVMGKGDVFESYKRFSPLRTFPAPAGIAQ
ncbi:MAG: sulfatase [Adhaeribacter sp.]